MLSLAKTPRSRAVLVGALLACLLYLWTLTPGYRLATVVEPPQGDDIRLFGTSTFQSIHRIGLVAGTVHRNDCLLEGVSSLDDYEDVPEHQDPDGKIVAAVAKALREQGLEVSRISAASLATHEAGVRLGPAGVSLGKPCTKAHDASNAYTMNDGWFGLTYPPVGGLVQGMAALPLDAVLVIYVNHADALPWRGGDFMDSSSPATAYVDLGAQLVAKDGSVPLAARVRAAGVLLHPGFHLPFTKTGGPAPKLQPVIEASATRLASLLK